MKEDQDSILITLSKQTIQDRRGGFRRILKEWYDSDGEHQTWWYKLGTAPKDYSRINWVYWVIDGRIRYRCRLLSILKNKEMTFNNQKGSMFAKNWLCLFDFEFIPRTIQIERKGFQGFRYFNSNLIDNGLDY